MAYELNKSNRESGSWVIGHCPYRAVPCDNPICADEAMRSKELKQTGDYLAEIQSRKAINHATSVAKRCSEKGHDCPLGNLENRLRVLAELAD